VRPEKEIFGGNPGRTIHEPAHLWTERPEKGRTAPTVVRYPLFDKFLFIELKTPRQSS
jgi:hypothetical protein